MNCGKSGKPKDLARIPLAELLSCKIATQAPHFDPSISDTPGMGGDHIRAEDTGKTVTA